MGFGSLADVVEPLLRTGGGARPLNLELERAKMRSETRTCGGQGYVWSGDEEEELVEARDTEPCSDEAESEQEDRRGCPKIPCNNKQTQTKQPTLQLKQK
ncbi:unnamed protein product [Polarella glacialis]|uniref:Uncharacterized protein n=1 Tax=Polarella glacialis TaxID=89957 RepID=A0A813ERY1_POLGL|nr:unnamed protein product [Polarella glacialis]